MDTFTPKFTTVADCVREAALVAAQQGTLASRIQHLATSLIYHVAQCGDWTMIIRCIASITKANGVNKQALLGYFESSLHATIDMEESTLTYDKGASAATIDMAQVAMVMWYDFKKVMPKSPAKSLGELREIFEKGAKKSVKAGKVTQDEVDLIIGTFEALISEHVAQSALAA